MCLAVPSRVLEIDDFRAMVDVYGARKEISLLLLPEEAHVGDFVLVHAGFAIQKIDEEGAKETMRLLKEIADAMDAEQSCSPPSA
ncbi:MAG: HypC/HybG/HupF family hydrogenase formation chaperone [Nitrospirales bacterium]|nr:HypC/HybG/HupF family hydrogenase formation chaperone [Nitrospirales bacterium]